MILALAFVLAFQQAESPQVGPPLQPGVRAEFQRTCIAIEQQLQQSDFQGAAALLKLLPKRSPRILWDDSKVPQNLRDAFKEARDHALRAWGSQMRNPEVVPEGQADIKIDFEPTLAPSGDSGLPAGAAFFFHDTPNPRLEIVIGLKRGRPAVDADENDVHNEVAYGIGAYLGLASTPAFGTSMCRTDLHAEFQTNPSPIDIFNVAKGFDVVNELSAAVAKKKQLIPTRPSLFIDPKSQYAGVVLEGKVALYSFQITNRGNSPLSYNLVPDCHCTSTDGPGVLAAGASALIHAKLDTQGMAGGVEKRPLLYSNDPDSPVTPIALDVMVEPRFRFLAPKLKSDVLIMPAGGAKLDVYLSLGKGIAIEPTIAELSGVQGEVTYEAWEGDLADPELKQPVRHRKGYHFSVALKDKMPSGRASSTLLVQTTDPDVPILRYTFAVQKGILADPESLFLGSKLGTAPSKGNLILSRPGKPFRVTKLALNSPHLTASFSPESKPDQYWIIVRYDGKANAGNLLATLTVYTDDPKQPKIQIPVSGLVR